MKRRLPSPLQDASSILTGKAILVYCSEFMERSSPERYPSMPTLTDVELLDSLKTKQSFALGCLYDRYGSVVYGVALKTLQSQSDAEDLTQEIFLSLWQRPVDPVKHGHLLRYLITMTRSRAIDKLRSRSRKLNLVQRWGENAIAETPTPTPVDRAVTNERSQQVRQALAQLSTQQRQAIELAYDVGLSQSEIAQQLNKPLGTVKSWTRQGLLRLKQLLRDSID
jgi:RNA polymerase sigma-70 factor, ECF subfamily